MHPAACTDLRMAFPTSNTPPELTESDAFDGGYNGGVTTIIKADRSGCCAPSQWLFHKSTIGR